MATNTREHLHRLVDQLPESEYESVAQYLQHLRDLANDPVYQAFMNAPIDDEPLTPEEEAAIEEARKEVARGEVVDWEEAQKLLFDDER